MKNIVLSKYISILRHENLIIDIINVNNMEESIKYISYDSKDVVDNTLFICKGINFKEEYLKDAVNNGAKWYISEKIYDIECGCILVSDIRKTMAIISDIYYDYPSKKLNLIGITGTKGKSTTLYFIKSILDEYAKSNNKKDTAIISTISTYLGDNYKKSILTTPESLELRKDFSIATDNNIKNLVMEVSSQALKYNRVYGITFNIGLFLNISEDHISNVEHKDFEDYFSSKLKIFSQTKMACINLDAEFSDRIYNTAKDNSKSVLTFSLRKKEADIFGYDLNKNGMKTVFKVNMSGSTYNFSLSMPGLFNVENALAAITVANAMNINYDIIYKGLENASVPGRMQIYSSKDKKIISIVDYAHNKVSFEKVYETIKKEYKNRKIITVFGCPGDKAQIRRKDLGIVSSKNSDYIVLTEDDPGFEDTGSICMQIAEFVKKYNNNYIIEVNRKKAIKIAIDYANNQDQASIILILGKGEEKTQKKAGKLEEYEGDMEIIANLM